MSVAPFPQPGTRMSVTWGVVAILLGGLAGCASSGGTGPQDSRYAGAPPISEPPRVTEPMRALPPGPGPAGTPYPSAPPVASGPGAEPARQPVWMDDPAKRRGPTGQPAPYGRDTVTGRPLADLQAGAPAPGDAAGPLGAPAAAGPVPGTTIVVQRGQTLTGIARRYKVSVDGIRRLNKLTSDKLKAGQSLVLPRT